ncbi:MAG TPA: aminomethyltransferase family protein [Candidatus Limnocylindria bacterium]|nr:aminomethyltransferase family protein [Candidatus Limnocylindria bacterium]
MIRTTPFHPRTSALNATGLWQHWSGHLAATRYQASDKFEYFAVRNAAGLFDTSPLYKYRIAGRDAERFLAGMLARDIRACPPGLAHYTTWLDERGFVLEDGVVQHRAPDEYLLTSPEPNFAWFADRIGRLKVTVEEVSLDLGALAIQGPRSRDLLARLIPAVAELPFFGLTTGRIGGRPVTVSRTGYTGDLGYEVWAETPDALTVWDAIWDAAEGHGVLPYGMGALYMLRIEAGLMLLGVDFDSSRFAFNDAHRSTPLELGWAWMFKGLEDDGRPFIGRRALLRERAEKTSRWRMVALVVDWQDYDRVYSAAGLIPPKDHRPVHEDWMVYDDERRRVGYATSTMYSPVLQRHIALARVRPDLGKPGTKVHLEFTVDHQYQQVAAHVARLPLFNPERKTA